MVKKVTVKVPSPYADGRGSVVNPDLVDAMNGRGGSRPPAASATRSRAASPSPVNKMINKRKQELEAAASGRTRTKK